MREEIVTWLSSLVLFSLLITLFLRVLPGKTYTPYIRLFTGFLLILLFLEPFLSIFQISDELAVRVNQELFRIETEQMESELIQMEENQKKYYEQAYKEEVEHQILSWGRENGADLLRVECKLMDGKMEKVSLVYGGKASAVSKKDLRNYIQDFYQIESDNIYVKVENPDEG